MASLNWTEEQLGVINSIDNNTLVSASAGSGKTTVMLERVMRLIMGESGGKRIPLRRIVMVTFNESVATELKNKVNARLLKKIAESEDKDYLRQQIEDIPLADISTMHSFCSTIIKNNFEFLGLQPSFSIVDESEKEMLFGKAIANVLKEYKENYDYQIDILINYLGGESGFCNTIARMYGFLEAQLDRDAWLTKLAFACYDGDFKDSKLANDYIDLLRFEISKMIEEGNDKRQYFHNSGMEKRYDHISITLEFMRKIVAAKNIEELADVVRYAPDIRPVPQSKKGDDVDKSIGEDYKAFNNACKDKIKELKSIFSDTYKILQENIDKNRIYLARLTGILKAVSDEYSALKKKDNKLDFADLEYYAVKAMQNDEIAKDLADSYDYICVDEYQDINAVQEYILSRLSNGKNMFMVGDVKQSIYQFRMTDPQIFLDKYHDYRQDSLLGSCHCLNSNYRSSREVIDFVNAVFDVIMKKECGGIDYRKESRLTQGNKDYEVQQGKPVCIACFPKDGKELQIPLDGDGVYSVRESICDGDTIVSKEGMYIAQKIKEMVGKKEIQVSSPDGGMMYRKIKYSDIALLCSKRSDGVERIVSTLKNSGIPVDSANILRERDNSCIELMTVFIKVLDNHKQDIPLVEVLTSGIFAQFSYKDMANIKLAYKSEEFFHQAVERYRNERDDATADKLKDFFAMLTKYRMASSFMSVSALMRKLTIDFDLRLHMSATDGGAQEFAGLERFIHSLESKNCNSSIARFADAVDNTADFGKVSDEAGFEGDCVVTNTIHKSKGLEYPIVFIIDAAKQVNMTDINAVNILFDKTYGFAIKDINAEERFYDDSLPFRLLRIMKGRDAIEEYMRLFYVAVTRARNMLYITSTGGLGKHSFAECAVKNPKSMLEWLNNIAIENNTFAQKYLDTDIELQGSQESETKKISARRIVEEDETREFTKSLAKNYGYMDSTALLVKHTVTAINNAYFEANNQGPEDENQMLDYIKDEDYSEEDNIAIRNYADEGIAYHRVLECIDFDCYTQDDVKSQIDGMVSQGLLSEEQRDLVDSASIYECLQSEIMQQARKYPHYREKQFMLNVPANEILDVNSSDKVLLQGTVDLFVQGGDKGGENILIDFKFSHKKPSQIKERYRKQLDLYAMAIEECLGIKVDKKIIFILGQNKTVEI